MPFDGPHGLHLQVWKRLMEERLACFRSELKELKAWVQAPKVVANVVELVLLMLGTHEVLVHRSCPWPQLRKLIDMVRDGKVKQIPIECRQLSGINQAVEDLEKGRVTGRIVFQPDQGKL